MPARHTAVIPADYTSAAIAPTIPASVIISKKYYSIYGNDYLVAILICQNIVSPNNIIIYSHAIQVKCSCGAKRSCPLPLYHFDIRKFWT